MREKTASSDLTNSDRILTTNVRKYDSSTIAKCLGECRKCHMFNKNRKLCYLRRK